MIKLRSRNGLFVKSFALFLLFSFAVLMICSFAFLHYHTLANGQIIAHSHFFKVHKNSDSAAKSQPVKHSHTKSEFLHFFISNLSDKFLAIVIVLLIFLAVIVFSAIPSYEKLFTQSFLTFISNRAPPAVILS